MEKIGSQESLKIMIIMKKHGVPDWKYHSSLFLGLIKPNKKYKQLFQGRKIYFNNVIFLITENSLD